MPLDRFDRYLHLMDLARRRYSVDGILVVSVGGEPSRYSKIERFLFRRILLAPSS